MKKNLKIWTLILAAIFLVGCDYLKEFSQKPKISQDFKKLNIPRQQPQPPKTALPAPVTQDWEIKILGLKNLQEEIFLFGEKDISKTKIDLGQKPTVLQTINLVKKNLNKKITVKIIKKETGIQAVSLIFPEGVIFLRDQATGQRITEKLVLSKTK